MKIVYVSPCLGCCGGVRVIFEHCERLTARGHEVRIVSEDGATHIDWLPTNLRIIPIDTVPDFSPDILVATAASTPYTVLDMIAHLDRECRLFYLVQGQETLFSDEPKWRTRASATYTMREFQPIVISRFLLNWLRDTYNRTPFYVPNGCNTEFFHPAKRFHGTKPRVLVEGPLASPTKRVKRTIECLAELDVEIWHLSPATDSHPVPSHTWLCPEQSMLARIYSSCHALVKMSCLEAGTPLPVMEAMACGCPSVTAATPGVGEYCIDGVNSLVVPIDDFDAARQAVISLLHDSSLAASIREGGLTTARTRFDWQPKIDLLEKIYAGEISPEETWQQAASAKL